MSNLKFQVTKLTILSQRVTNYFKLKQFTVQRVTKKVVLVPQESLLIYLSIKPSNKNLSSCISLHFSLWLFLSGAQSLWEPDTLCFWRLQVVYSFGKVTDVKKCSWWLHLNFYSLFAVNIYSYQPFLWPCCPN